MYRVRRIRVGSSSLGKGEEAEFNIDCMEKGGTERERERELSLIHI